MFDFDFTCFNEDCVIIGMKGGGKTYLANEFLRSLKNIPVIVFDFNWGFHDSRAVVVHNLQEVFKIFDEMRGHVIFQPYDKSQAVFESFCSQIFARSNLVALIDESHQYVSKQKICKPYNDLILSGRPRGISVISISSRPANLPNNALTNARHIFAFRLNLQSDVEFLQSWLGDQAWELLPKEQRKKNQDAPELEQFSFYYRDTQKAAGMVGKI